MDTISDMFNVKHVGLTHTVSLDS